MVPHEGRRGLPNQDAITGGGFPPEWARPSTPPPNPPGVDVVRANRLGRELSRACAAERTAQGLRDRERSCLLGQLLDWFGSERAEQVVRLASAYARREANQAECGAERRILERELRIELAGGADELA